MRLAKSAALIERGEFQILRLDADGGGDVVADEPEPGQLLRREGRGSFQFSVLRETFDWSQASKRSLTVSAKGARRALFQSLARQRRGGAAEGMAFIDRRFQAADLLLKGLELASELALRKSGLRFREIPG